MTQVRILTRADTHVLNNLAPGMFDGRINAKITAAFLDDPRHILVVALDGDLVVGSISSVEYFHPDKSAPELWINEVDVSPSHQRQGLARRMLDLTLGAARERGCLEAWVLTEPDNEPARALYGGTNGALPAREVVEFTFDLTARDG